MTEPWATTLACSIEWCNQPPTQTVWAPSTFGGAEGWCDPHGPFCDEHTAEALRHFAKPENAPHEFSPKQKEQPA